MAKLIRSHKECGHRVIGNCLYFIHHNENSNRYMKCNPKSEQNFPPNCPLEDGMPLETNSENKPKHNGRFFI